MAEIKIDDVRDVWIVWKNTDDTEGRGAQYISHTCETEATALRVGRGKYVMGGNCPIEKAKSYKINGSWHQPSPIVPTSDDDKKVQAKMDSERSVKGLAEKALINAAELGLSPDDIAALKAAI